MTPEEQMIAAAAATSPDALAKMASEVYGFDLRNVESVCGYIGTKLAYQRQINRRINEGVLAFEALK